MPKTAFEGSQRVKIFYFQLILQTEKVLRNL